MKQSFIQNWLSNNALKLIGAAIVLIGMFYVFQARLDAVEKRVAEYPSVDYFELKFQTIDEKLLILQEELQEHKQATE